MDIVWVLPAVLQVIVAAVSIVDIVRRPLDRSRTAAWVLIVLIVPFIGSAFYWLTGRGDQEATSGGLSRP